MSDFIDEKVRAHSRWPHLQAYDITATFGDGQTGRTIKRLVDETGKHHLDSRSWEAGDIAYQCLKQVFPDGITHAQFKETAQSFYSLVCDELYPSLLSRAEAGEIDVQPNGVDGMKRAWFEYDWCERVMLAYDFIDGMMAAGDPDFDHPLNTVLPLVLLQRLDDAAIAEFLDGRGLPEVMLEIASLKDRLQPPKHVQIVIDKLQGKVDTFTRARRKGADVLHAESRGMKADIFKWLDTQPKFKSIESAATAITKQQPIAHVTGRLWYKEWKKLRSASTP